MTVGTNSFWLLLHRGTRGRVERFVWAFSVELDFLPRFPLSDMFHPLQSNGADVDQVNRRPRVRTSQRKTRQAKARFICLLLLPTIIVAG